MDPTLAFRVYHRELPELEVRVNFGVFAGRNATPAEIDDLARSLHREVPSFAIVAEERHEFGDEVEASLHQVVIEIAARPEGDDSDELAIRIVDVAERWAAECVRSRSELGELRER